MFGRPVVYHRSVDPTLHTERSGVSVLGAEPSWDGRVTLDFRGGALCFGIERPAPGC